MISSSSPFLYSSYYQAYVNRQLCWFVTATLRSCDHLVFDRTLDPEAHLLEFFVAPELEKYFLEMMTYFEGEGLISDFKKLPNRLAEHDAQV